jgi:hypothetical protein
VLVNYSDRRGLRSYHGKLIALDIDHRYAPFPSIFIIHEMRVRGFHPFAPTQPDMPQNIPWQDWITSEDALQPDGTQGLFRREEPPPDPAGNPQNVPPQTQPQNWAPNTAAAGITLSDTRLPPLSGDTIAKILEATRNSASWRSCEMENTSWEGTADENRAKYLRLFRSTPA